MVKIDNIFVLKKFFFENSSPLVTKYIYFPNMQYIF